MKTNKTSLFIVPSTADKEENEMLDAVTKLTNEKSKKVLTRYPFNLTGVIVEVYNKGSARIQFDIDEKEYCYNASSTQILQEMDAGKECLVVFNHGKIDSPIIIGIIQTQKSEPLVFSSSEGIVLECGNTRIVLDVDGTLDLKALHINSQAYGPYRIKGASVKIN